MNFIFKFLEFIEGNKLIERDQKTLLAVSGGIDSVAMAHFFYISKYEFEIAHCNFGLRGKESDQDEVFCRELAEKYNVSFFSTKFDTQKYARENKVSIQTAARDLRYKWLEEVRQQHNLDLIATAHHLDDNAETMLFNIARGTGYAGIKGIPLVNKLIVRPLMVFQRDEIESFLFQNNLKYREDSSNIKTDYSRNKIRNNVFPVLKEINPDVIRNFASLANIAKKTEELLIYLINKEGLLVEKGNEYHIPIEKLNKYPVRETLLYHILKEFGFSPSQTRDIKSTSKTQPGKYFKSDNYILIRDRENFIVAPIKDEFINGDIDIIPDQICQINNNLCLNTSVKDKSPDFSIPKESNFAALDFDLLKFPLKLRKWKEGDSFCPFGMEGRKKISDFLIDIKTPLHKKEEVLVLLSGDDIVWVVGHRPDNNYCVTDSTKKIFIAKSFHT
ncbi:MAG: tRNA lysidine(34) synthetase TilS [Bacteroidales bacterium]